MEAQAVGSAPQTAIFLAGGGGPAYARALHFATGLKLLTPPQLTRFEHALRWHDQPVHDGARDSRPALTGLAVERAASRRHGVLVEVSGLDAATVKLHRRAFEDAGYTCVLLRIQTPTSATDRGLDEQFRHLAFTFKGESATTPWLRLYDTALRDATRRVLRAVGRAHTRLQESADVIVSTRMEPVTIWTCPHCRDELREKSTYFDMKEQQEFHRACGQPITRPQSGKVSWPWLADLDESIGAFALVALVPSERKLYFQWLELANMDVDTLTKFQKSFVGQHIQKKQQAGRLRSERVIYNKDAALWTAKLRDTPLEEWTPKHWQWAKRQVVNVLKNKKVKGPLRRNRQPTPKLQRLLLWGHDPLTKVSPPHLISADPEPDEIAEKYDGRTGPKFKTLKANQVKLDPEERALVMQRKAVWHPSNHDKPTSAVFKSVMPDGRTWYTTHTHRAYNVTPTLQGTIQRYHDFIKGTA